MPTSCCSTTWIRRRCSRRPSTSWRDALSPKRRAASPTTSAAAIAATGVDYLSSGAITHSSVNLDVGLDIIVLETRAEVSPLRAMSGWLTPRRRPPSPCSVGLGLLLGLEVLAGLLVDHLHRQPHLAALVEAQSLTLTLSPSLTTSVIFWTRRGASWLMCTRPSAPKKFTKAPKSITLTTVPS